MKLLREAGSVRHIPEGGFETFPMVPSSFDDSIEFTRYLVENAGVLVKPGIFFGPDGDRFFRVVYCVDEDAIRKGMVRVAKAMSRA